MDAVGSALILFCPRKKHGMIVPGLPPVIAIAPEYLPTDVHTPTWLLEQVRMDVPSDLIKLRPGSAVCLQDLSLHDSFYAPAIPTMLGVINRMLWHEEGYQIASVGTHVYSPSGYDVQFEGFVLSPSPFPSSTQPFISPELSRERLARRSSMTKYALLLEIGKGWELVGEYVI